MTAQTFYQCMAVFGLLLTAAGGFGSYYYGKIEDAKTQRDASEMQNALRGQITKLEKNFDTKTDLIFQALNVKPDVWTEVQVDSVPPGVTDYLLLLFRADRGRISGKARIKGSEKVVYFSTTVNDNLAVAVPNLWVSKDKQYKIPTILEFAVTEKTINDSNLSILTQGWIDSRGQEPH